jgi:hypothetical protein
MHPSYLAPECAIWERSQDRREAAQRERSSTRYRLLIIGEVRSCRARTRKAMFRTPRLRRPSSLSVLVPDERKGWQDVPGPLPAPIWRHRRAGYARVTELQKSALARAPDVHTIFHSSNYELTKCTSPPTCDDLAVCEQ